MELPSLLGGGIKSPQSGWIETTTPTMVAAVDLTAARNATGEDQVYVDVTISAVDVTKAVINVVGGFGYYTNALYPDLGAYKPRLKSSIYLGSGAYGAVHDITARLINSTTLRLSSDRPAIQDSMVVHARLAARWTVVEGK